jgi:hypothetical protein
VSPVCPPVHISPSVSLFAACLRAQATNTVQRSVHQSSFLLFSLISLQMVTYFLAFYYFFLLHFYLSILSTIIRLAVLFLFFILSSPVNYTNNDSCIDLFISCLVHNLALFSYFLSLTLFPQCFVSSLFFCPYCGGF